MISPDHKLFRCEIWAEDEGGLYVEYMWGRSLEEITDMFGLSKEGKLYKVQEASAEGREAWLAGYDDGVTIGMVGERMKSRAKDITTALPEDVQAMFEELSKEQEQEEESKNE